jgi:hypothetical protein
MLAPLELVRSHDGVDEVEKEENPDKTCDDQLNTHVLTILLRPVRRIFGKR